MTDRSRTSGIVDPESSRGAPQPNGSAARPRSLLARLRIEPTPSTLAAGAVFLLLVGVALFGLPRFLPINPTPSVPLVASATACASPAECAVTVHFSAPVDRGAVADSLTVTPTTNLVVTWSDDQTLSLRPAPLLPTVSYVVRLIPLGLDHASGRQPAPVTVSFVARAANGPVQLVTPSAAPPAVVPTLVPTVIATSTTAPRPVSTVAGVAVTPVPTSTTTAPAAASACALMPVRGFGLFYQNDSGVAGRLGCAVSPEAGSTAAVQQFDHGQLLRVADRPETLVLSADGRWAHYSDATPTSTAPTPADLTSALAAFLHDQSSVRTALGSPSGDPRSLAAATETFDRGFLVWTADRVIYAIYADGTWEQRADTFVDPTETAVAATTSTGANPTATPMPPASAAPASAQPAVAPPTANCAIQPVRGFGLVYSQNTSLAIKIGCAQSAETGIDVTRETFDGGTMLQTAGSSSVLVLRKDGSFASLSSSGPVGTVLPSVGTPPDGHIAPTGSFGAIWSELGGPRSTLGWATAPSAIVSGAVESFASGQMIWTADRVIYALFNDGTYVSFADKFIDSATPTPGGNG